MVEEEEEVVPVVPDGSKRKGRGNTRPSPAKRWCFTLHNGKLSEVVPILKSLSNKGIIAKETGKSGETPHLQGYIEFTDKKRPIGILDKSTHWELAKGNSKQNYDYCAKEQGEIECWGFPEPLKIPLKEDLYNWQVDICNILDTVPDNRTINWYWSKDGGVGKTTFAKYLYVHYGTIALNGKASDIRNGIIDYLETKGDTPKSIIVNIPRCFNSDYLSYEGLENIKDMYFYSGKYKGGMVCGNSPHLIVFANTSPDTEKMSDDRWNIVEIKTVCQSDHATSKNVQ